MNTTSAPYSVSTSRPRYLNTPSPLLPTVTAIAAPMPIGAKPITRFVNLNMISESDSQNRSIVCLRRAGCFRDRDAEQHREEHDLEHFVVRRRLGETLRHDVLEHVRDRHLVSGEFLAGRVRGGRDVHADAGLHPVHRDESHRERERRDDLEIDDRPQREPADALHVVAVARDPHHERAEDQRHDQQLDHPQEHRAQRLERRGEVRIQRAGNAPTRAEDHRDDDPLGEGEFLQETHDGGARR